MEEEAILKNDKILKLSNCFFSNVHFVFLLNVVFFISVTLTVFDHREIRK